jgi:hypothetical protein
MAIVQRHGELLRSFLSQYESTNSQHMSPNLPSDFVCMRTRFLVASADVRVVLCLVLILAVAGGYAFAAMVLFGHQFNEVSEFGSAISSLFDIILVMDTCMYSCSLHSCHPSISPSDTVQTGVHACTRAHLCSCSCTC